MKIKIFIHSNLVLFCAIFSQILVGFSWADEFLFFPIEKNKIQILPQRFEYQLIDKDQMRIGEWIVDGRKFKLSIIPSINREKATSQYVINVQWPYGLIKDGELVLKDHTGRARWVHSIKIEEVNYNKNEGISRYQNAAFPSEMFEKLQFLPYFKMCILKQDSLTRVLFCSKEFYFHWQGKSYSLESRDSLRAESFVEINGALVNPQGYIFLQDLSNVLSLRALFLSGVNLEIFTRPKKVEFRDFSVSSKNESELIIQAVGAEPAEPTTSNPSTSSNLTSSNPPSSSSLESVESKFNQSESRRRKWWWSKTIESNGSHALPAWKKSISKERPSLYLMGEGGIPMRQEFLIGGPVKKETLKVPLKSDPTPWTYEESFTFETQKIPEIQLKPYVEGKVSMVISESPSEGWALQMKDLKKNQTQRRFVQVHSEGNSYVAAYDMFRGFRHELLLGGAYPFQGHFAYQGWLNLNWGFMARLQYISLNSSLGEGSLFQNEIAALYRWGDGGLFYNQNYWGIKLSLMPISINVKSVSINSFTSEGVGIIYNHFDDDRGDENFLIRVNNPTFWNKTKSIVESLMDQYSIEFNYILLSQSVKYSVQNFWNFSWKSRYYYRPHRFFEPYFQYQNLYLFEESPSSKSVSFSQTSVGATMGLLF